MVSFDNKLVLFDENGNTQLDMLFSEGNINKVIEYNKYFLVLSTNTTGDLPQPPYISSIWRSTELVYSGYNYSGKLLWRDAYDNTPEYMKFYKSSSE